MSGERNLRFFSCYFIKVNGTLTKYPRTGIGLKVRRSFGPGLTALASLTIKKHQQILKLVHSFTVNDKFSCTLIILANSRSLAWVAQCKISCSPN